MAHFRFAGMSALATISVLFTPMSAQPCSRIVWNDNGRAVVVGRSMDWLNPMPTDLYLLPRGIKRDGMTGKNTLAWTAKYGTVTAVPSRGGASGTADGVNEKGLAGSLLWLAESDYGKYDPDRPSLSLGLWLQYYLDNFATVQEAVEFTEKSPPLIVTGSFDGRRVTNHLALSDATGDTMVIEYIGGKPVIHHGKQYTVMTNSPPYDQQLKQLQQFKGFGGEKPLPGTTEAADRFVRGAYYLNHLPKPADYRETVAGALSVIRNISAPFGEADPARPNISATRWRTVADLTNRIYYFESSTSPNLIWVKLDGLDFSNKAGIRKIDLVKYPDRVGDVTKQFEPAKPFAVGLPDLN
ncbi:choloylglycine hydrolase [freshwater sediment metagenome]|uniref:Choloylglycine hydrolase n=1 Tax=freshwater sediment metagenome TaxID=556182 RepID=A0AA48REI8_9ZZZZ